MTKRANEANDPYAIGEVGLVHYTKGDYDKAFQHWTKAAGLGDIEAHYYLSVIYFEGEGVERDIKKAVYYWEEAAIGGHHEARFKLGAHEWKFGSKERAVKHWIIAANLGEDKSMKTLGQAYMKGLLSKDDYAATLRAYQDAVDAMKSPQREAAYKTFLSFVDGP